MQNKFLYDLGTCWYNLAVPLPQLSTISSVKISDAIQNKAPKTTLHVVTFISQVDGIKQTSNSRNLNLADCMKQYNRILNWANNNPPLMDLTEIYDRMDSYEKSKKNTIERLKKNKGNDLASFERLTGQLIKDKGTPFMDMSISYDDDQESIKVDFNNNKRFIDKVIPEWIDEQRMKDMEDKQKIMLFITDRLKDMISGYISEYDPLNNN